MNFIKKTAALLFLSLSIAFLTLSLFSGTIILHNDASGPVKVEFKKYNLSSYSPATDPARYTNIDHIRYKGIQGLTIAPGTTESFNAVQPDGIQLGMDNFTFKAINGEPIKIEGKFNTFYTLDRDPRLVVPLLEIWELWIKNA